MYLPTYVGLSTSASRMTSYDTCDDILSEVPSHVGVFAELDASVLIIKRIIPQVEFNCVGDVITHIDMIPVSQFSKSLLRTLLQEPGRLKFTVISWTDHINACARRKDNKAKSNKIKYFAHRSRKGSPLVLVEVIAVVGNRVDGSAASIGDIITHINDVEVNHIDKIELDIILRSPSYREYVCYKIRG